MAKARKNRAHSGRLTVLSVMLIDTRLSVMLIDNGQGAQESRALRAAGRSGSPPGSWPVTAPAAAPTPPGDGPGPVRAAPLPSTRVVVVGGILWGSPAGRCVLWIGVPPPLRRRPPPSRHVPLAHPAGTRGGVAPSAARPGPGASPSWAGSRRRRGLHHGGLADSEGSPGPAPGRGPPGGPNQGRVGGARRAKGETRSERAPKRLAFRGSLACSSSRPPKSGGRKSGGRAFSGPTKCGCVALRKAEDETTSKRDAQANASSSLEFLLALQASRVAIRVWALTRCSVASVGRPCSGWV